LTAEEGKRRAAVEAAQLIEDGMTVGLGTGSTVAYLLPALAARNLQIRCVSTSVRTEEDAAALGLPVEPFSRLDRLDVAIDGADQVDGGSWLVKGGGAAHTREKIVAGAADRFIVIVSPEKVVEAVRPPIPLELMAFGLESTLRRLGSARLRPGAPPSPDGGIIADWMDPFDDPAGLAAYLAATPGVVDHGLFPPAMVSQVIVGGRQPAPESPG
jgi:ribose 5-phosphate isomerase A